MYTSLKEAKQAVLAVGEEIKNAGLPLGICPLIFVFTGTGNGKIYAEHLQVCFFKSVE
jgi:alpha-aminoadipic semialdehyde synthase